MNLLRWLRLQFWSTYAWIRHPLTSWAAQQYLTIPLSRDAHASLLPVYGNFELRAYSGVQLQGAEIVGDADSLRRLAKLLLDRARRVESVQALLDSGEWPAEEDRDGFPPGFGTDIPLWGLQLGNAPQVVDAP